MCLFVLSRARSDCISRASFVPRLFNPRRMGSLVRCLNHHSRYVRPDVAGKCSQPIGMRCRNSATETTGAAVPGPITHLSPTMGLPFRGGQTMVMVLPRSSQREQTGQGNRVLDTGGFRRGADRASVWSNPLFTTIKCTRTAGREAPSPPRKAGHAGVQ